MSFNKKRGSILDGLFLSLSDSDFFNVEEVEKVETVPQIIESTSVSFPFQNQKRWECVVGILKTVKIHEFNQLQTVLSMINGATTDLEIFELYENLSTEKEKKVFYERIIPFMVELILKTPTLFPEDIPLSKQSKSYSISLSREQCACILSNSFFCTFDKISEPSTWTQDQLSSINFDELFDIALSSKVKVEKIRMIINYFDRISQKLPQGNIVFERKFICDNPSLTNNSKKLKCIKIVDKGELEDDLDSLKVNSGSAFFGGTCLSFGKEKEEILYCIHPELICSRLFFQRLLHNEVLKISGYERFSSYKEIKDGFEFKNNFIDENVESNEMVMMDPLVLIGKEKSQWKKIKIDREIHKSYIAFEDNKQSWISTLNWGENVKGDPELKAVIQIISSVHSDQKLIYHVKNDSFEKKLKIFCDFLISKEIPMDKLYLELIQYSNLDKILIEQYGSVFKYLMKKLK
eukprot:gene9432-1638_t